MGRAEKRQELMLNELLLHARHALHSVLQSVHLSSRCYHSVAPHSHTLYEEGTKKGDFEEIIWSNLLIS